jgi:hypothetical protein
MLRKLLLAAVIVSVLPLSFVQAGVRGGIGIGVPIGAPLPSYSPNYRPYYTPYFYPLPTFYAAPPVCNGLAPICVQPGQTPAYVLPQNQLNLQPLTQPGLVQPLAPTSMQQN